jgi:predicted permease
MAEGVLLSVAGAVASLPLADWTLHLLVSAIRASGPAIPDAHLDVRVMAATFAAAGAIGIGFGLAPVLLLARGRLEAVLHTGGRGSSASRWSVALRRGVVAAQVALCLVLLSAAALLAQSFVRMNSMSTGLRADHIVMAGLDLMPGRYESWEARGRFYGAVLRNAAALPGVSAAAITSRVDLLQPGLGYRAREAGKESDDHAPGGARGRSVSPGYFELLGIPVLRGRAFTDRDSLTAPRVMIVNEAFARKFFDGRDPVGRHIVYSTDGIDCEIVGLVRDVRASLRRSDPEPTMYLPLEQRPWLVARLLVRSAAPSAVAASLRAAIREADPEQAAGQPEMLEEALAASLGQPRLTMSTVAAFAAVALLLAGIGIYGVTRYGIAQRRREIGIRIALGAHGAQVRGMVLRQNALVLGAGLAAGAPLSIAASQLYRALLFQVEPADVRMLAGVAAVLSLITLAASWFPASQAARIDPATSLRAE